MKSLIINLPLWRQLLKCLLIFGGSFSVSFLICSDDCEDKTSIDRILWIELSKIKWIECRERQNIEPNHSQFAIRSFPQQTIEKVLYILICFLLLDSIRMMQKVKCISQEIKDRVWDGIEKLKLKMEFHYFISYIEIFSTCFLFSIHLLPSNYWFIWTKAESLLFSHPPVLHSEQSFVLLKHPSAATRNGWCEVNPTNPTPTPKGGKRMKIQR